MCAYEREPPNQEKRGSERRVGDVRKELEAGSREFFCFPFILFVCARCGRDDFEGRIL